VRVGEEKGPVSGRCGRCGHIAEAHCPGPSDPCCMTEYGVCLDYVPVEDRTTEKEGRACECPSLVVG
jgi:hypothetical protein